MTRRLEYLCHWVRANGPSGRQWENEVRLEYIVSKVSLGEGHKQASTSQEPNGGGRILKDCSRTKLDSGERVCAVAWVQARASTRGTPPPGLPLAYATPCSPLALPICPSCSLFDICEL
jgi:hypothetical protein